MNNSLQRGAAAAAARRCRPMPQMRQTGQATIEYTLVVIALVVIMLAQPSVLEQLADALKQVYASFVYAISVSDLLIDLPSPPTPRH